MIGISFGSVSSNLTGVVYVFSFFLFASEKDKELRGHWFLLGLLCFLLSRNSEVGNSMNLSPSK